jgi:hypothetical protein
MVDWLRGGVLIQVTADSLTGHKGRRRERMAHELLEKRWVHFLATDAHNTSSRPPRMREAHDLVAGKYGASYAHSLCVTNPLAVFLGKQFAGRRGAARTLFRSTGTQPLEAAAGKTLAGQILLAGRPSLQTQPAIDRKQLPGDEVGAGGEEQHRLGDILGGAIAPHRRASRRSARRPRRPRPARSCPAQRSSR